mmetsp:Transcript_13940/g.28565  ORF Transcript_13940/g.28565 Transcript_13940/m.28565 type:complete len:200 (+) Transcript_13940:2-601(+)
MEGKKGTLLQVLLLLLCQTVGGWQRRWGARKLLSLQVASRQPRPNCRACGCLCGLWATPPRWRQRLARTRTPSRSTCKGRQPKPTTQPRRSLCRRRRLWGNLHPVATPKAFAVTARKKKEDEEEEEEEEKQPAPSPSLLPPPRSSSSSTSVPTDNPPPSLLPLSLPTLRVVSLSGAPPPLLASENLRGCCWSWSCGGMD